ncbi:MAG: ComEA family DNA-binding protein [Labedaea sp.]
MFLTTARRTDRDTQVRDRLAQLLGHARTEAHGPAGELSDDLPADQEWIDESTPATGAGPPGDPWWRRGGAGRLVERWLPGTGVPSPPRRRLPVLVAALAVAVVAAVTVALSSSSGGREPPPNLPVAAASVEPQPGTRPGAAAPIVVSVVGRVVRPGLVTLPDGARVADALQAAGGPAPGVDVGGLNIARRLSDGEQLYVGVAAPAEAAVSAAPVPGSAGKVDLNSASVAQLDTLPGVGAVTAQRIVDWRTEHGRFARVDQLREVDGIGPAKFGRLKDQVVVR